MSEEKINFDQVETNYIPSDEIPKQNAVGNIMEKFLTKKSYQRGLVLYLFLTIPTGTYYIIKGILSLIFQW